ncbi:MAG: hypothetical protein QHJ34_12110 [bacterium]|nr:hypothetical protein [candidate division KSB1 bacterium]MDH7560956.1 hypothetical protein [bacterium]
MEQRISIRMSALLLVVTSALMVCEAAPLLAHTSQPAKASAELQQFDTVVLETRQQMRQYCALV